MELKDIKSLIEKIGDEAVEMKKQNIKETTMLGINICHETILKSIIEKKKITGSGYLTEDELGLIFKTIKEELSKQL